MDIRSSLLVLIVLLFESVSSDSCQPIVDSLRNQGHVSTHNSICYVFLNHEKTWVDARAQCENWGGDMVHIPDKGTMDFLRRVMGNTLRWRNNGVWIGLHSRGSGGWKWTTGDRQTYSYWESGQPSKIFGLLSFEDCACMRRNDNWRWHDYFCDNKFYKYKYICQFRMLKTTTTSTTTTTAATTTTTEKTTTTTVATTTVKSATTTASTLPATIAPVISIVYNKRLEATTSGTGHHVIVQGIGPDSSKGEQVAQNMRPKGDRGLSDSSKGTIIGLVLGGFIMFVVSCMIFILFRRRRRRKRESDNLTVQFESAGYMHGYSQGYSPISQNEQSNQVANGNRPESHMYMDTSEMNRLYEQVTKQVDHGVNDYDQLKPKNGACAGAAEGECCEESDLKKEKVNLPEESDGSSHSNNASDGPSQMNNANEYVDMGASKPKLTNLEVNTHRVEKQNNLQQSEPVYTNENFHRERLQTPTEEELEILDYEEHVPGDNLTDPLYDVVN